MSEQTGPDAGHPSGAPGGATSVRDSGPRVTGDQMRDVARLRRSGTDRYVAGVAGGLGRHFDVDPTVIRVLLAVLTFFGGAGVLVYAAVWLFVPEDGSDRAPLEVGGEARRVILVVAAALALLIVFGSPFLDGSWGWSFPFPLLVVGLVVVAVVATRQRRARPTAYAAPPPPWGTPPPGASMSSAPSAPSAPPARHPFEGPTMSSTQTLPTTAQAPTQPAAQGPAQAPPAWMPPPTPAYVPPPRPRRSGLVLFWPTLALIAIGLGTLGIVDVSHGVPFSAYAALAVAVTGLALLVGAFVGRPGGLIALGLLTTLALVVTSVVGAVVGGSTRSEDLRFAPTTSTALEDAYSIETGSLTLDLSGVRDVAGLDGRALALRANAGEIRVVLPPGVNADVDARVRYAGQTDVVGTTRGGFGFSTTRSVISSSAPGTPTVSLDLFARVGQITVEQR